MQTQNHKAVIQLKLLGFPLVNIRKSMSKLTGISQPNIAERIGTSRQNITSHVKGRSHNPETQEKIAEVWQVPAHELFENRINE